MYNQGAHPTNKVGGDLNLTLSFFLSREKNRYDGEPVDKRTVIRVTLNGLADDRNGESKK